MLTDEQLADILRYDFSKGTEKFRDELLARCLAILDEGTDGVMDNMPSANDFAPVDESDCCELGEADLRMVAGGTDLMSSKSKGDAIIGQ